MSKILSYSDSLDLIQKYYSHCLAFWAEEQAKIKQEPIQLNHYEKQREILMKQAHELAADDVRKLEEDPFGSGMIINTDAKDDFLRQISGE